MEPTCEVRENQPASHHDGKRPELARDRWEDCLGTGGNDDGTWRTGATGALA
jgi:hypothetical protein